MEPRRDFRRTESRWDDGFTVNGVKMTEDSEGLCQSLMDSKSGCLDGWQDTTSTKQLVVVFCPGGRGP